MQELITPEYLIWDLDDTVWWHCKKELVFWAKKLGISYTDELQKQFLDLIEQYDCYFKTAIVTQDAIADLIRDHMPILQVYGISPYVFLDVWKNADTNILNREAAEMIKYYHEQGKKNIVRTDWLYTPQVNRLKKFGLLDYIEKVHSSENGYLKTNPKTISNVIIQGREEDYLMIGNSLSSDIAFANLNQIKSIYYNRNGQPNKTCFTPTFELAFLKDMLKFVA